MRSTLRRTATVVAAVLVTAAILVASPASGHVTKKVAHLWKHLKPLADAAYYSKGSTVVSSNDVVCTGCVSLAEIATEIATKAALDALGVADGTINESGDPVDWTKLKGVPGDFADGQDDAGSSLPAYCGIVAEPGNYAPCVDSRQTVDAAGFVGTWSAIAIGTDGNPVISYADDSNGHLKVARCNDPACAGGDDQITSVDTAGDVGDVSSIAIGTDGNPVISYIDNGNDDIKVAKCNDPACAGANETITTVDSGGTLGVNTSIAIGTDGNPVIVYGDDSNDDLKVAKCNDPACAGLDETITAADTTDLPVGTSLAIGSDGNPVIGYRYSNGPIVVTKCNDQACAGTNETTSTVEAGLHCCGTLSLTLGTDGNPVLSFYSGGAADDLRVAACNDPACAGSNESLNTVDSVGDVGINSSVVIGPDGNPIIAYNTGGAAALKLARCNDPACAGQDEAISTLDNGGGQTPSIALDTDLVPVIGYQNNAFDLRVARPAGG